MYGGRPEAAFAFDHGVMAVAERAADAMFAIGFDVEERKAYCVCTKKISFISEIITNSSGYNLWDDNPPFSFSLSTQNPSTPSHLSSSFVVVAKWAI